MPIVIKSPSEAIDLQISPNHRAANLALLAMGCAGEPQDGKSKPESPSGGTLLGTTGGQADPNAAIFYQMNPGNVAFALAVLEHAVVAGALGSMAALKG